MFSLKLKSFGFIAPKTWETLAETKGFKLDREHQLRSPMFKEQ
jgi:hypothetical protein